jgi:hypothetical protein
MGCLLKSQAAGMSEHGACRAGGHRPPDGKPGRKARAFTAPVAQVDIGRLLKSLAVYLLLQPINGGTH